MTNSDFMEMDLDWDDGCSGRAVVVFLTQEEISIILSEVD
jgi:hypothetical protein